MVGSLKQARRDFGEAISLLPPTLYLFALVPYQLYARMEGCGLCTVTQNTLKIGQRYSTVLPAHIGASEQASEEMSAAERASEASSAEQTNE